MGNRFQKLTALELARARAKFGPINSGHEGYAVIREELEEFFDLCREWKGENWGPLALKELIQIAAMAQRTAEDLGCLESEDS